MMYALFCYSDHGVQSLRLPRCTEAFSVQKVINDLCLDRGMTLRIVEFDLEAGTCRAVGGSVKEAA